MNLTSDYLVKRIKISLSVLLLISFSQTVSATFAIQVYKENKLEFFLDSLSSVNGRVHAYAQYASNEESTANTGSIKPDKKEEFFEHSENRFYLTRVLDQDERESALLTGKGVGIVLSLAVDENKIDSFGLKDLEEVDMGIGPNNEPSPYLAYVLSDPGVREALLTMEESSDQLYCKSLLNREGWLNGYSAVINGLSFIPSCIYPGPGSPYYAAPSAAGEPKVIEVKIPEAPHESMTLPDGTQYHYIPKFSDFDKEGRYVSLIGEINIDSKNNSPDAHPRYKIIKVTLRFATGKKWYYPRYLYDYKLHNYGDRKFGDDDEDGHNGNGGRVNAITSTSSTTRKKESGSQGRPESTGSTGSTGKQRQKTGSRDDLISDSHSNQSKAIFAAPSDEAGSQLITEFPAFKNKITVENPLPGKIGRLSPSQ